MDLFHTQVQRVLLVIGFKNFTKIKIDHMPKVLHVKRSTYLYVPCRTCLQGAQTPPH